MRVSEDKNTRIYMIKATTYIALGMLVFSGIAYAQSRITSIFNTTHVSIPFATVNLPDYINDPAGACANTISDPKITLMALPALCYKYLTPPAPVSVPITPVTVSPILTAPASTTQ